MPETTTRPLGGADHRDGGGKGLAQPVGERGMERVEPGALGRDGAERGGADIGCHGAAL